MVNAYVQETAKERAQAVILHCDRVSTPMIVDIEVEAGPGDTAADKAAAVADCVREIIGDDGELVRLDDADWLLHYSERRGGGLAAVIVVKPAPHEYSAAVDEQLEAQWESDGRTAYHAPESERIGEYGGPGPDERLKTWMG